jgi:hypothetical protein
LLLAASLKVMPRRKNEDPVRRANCITRILGKVRGLRTKPAAPSFGELAELK